MGNLKHGCWEVTQGSGEEEVGKLVEGMDTLSKLKGMSGRPPGGEEWKSGSGGSLAEE